MVLRTSFIVGFPGEQEEDFRQLLNFVAEAALDHVGVFRYSQEEGTAAGVMAEHVPEEVKQERWQRLMEQQARVVRRKNLALIGALVASAAMLLGIGAIGLWKLRGPAPTSVNP